MDFEPVATRVYRDNYPFAERIATDSVESFFDGELGAKPTFTEHKTMADIGAVTVLTGGPPCQGHSNLNNHTRRVDPKNGLYLRMVRAAEILSPELILIENVPAVLRDRHDGEGVVVRAERHLQDIGYQVGQAVVALDTIGVAQTRRRHVLLATRDGDIAPRLVLEALAKSADRRDLRWAIHDLMGADDGSLRDRAPRAKADNQARMRWMLENDAYDLPNHLRPKCHQDDHSYKSMYGRLRWEDPAQTITSGFGSIGQGRFMHPELPRALTAHEAARIQGFPDYFDFSGCSTGSALATMIGNAVPPPLGAAILQSVFSLRAQAKAEAAFLTRRSA
ncbi:DNA (cytosine-5)-methyltransferase 1 [Agrococcus carbonis]|uniref:DNA (cytosine-5-)-methyltransferase n=1 Tax=Agrococcus carbonis TaxID=684552 RepID=A0A1H1PZ33_9MICO|nr:DNA (cytosine-5)-methyltransferase 1 [Agrococcus carbonis]